MKGFRVDLIWWIGNICKSNNAGRELHEIKQRRDKTEIHKELM